MIALIILLIVILCVLFIIVLMIVGLCIGIAYLMMYFIPTLGLDNVLTPAAILTTMFIVMLGSLLHYWISTGVEHTYRPLNSDYLDDEDEVILPIMIINKARAFRSKKVAAKMSPKPNVKESRL
jgi:hypothetical protein